MFDTTNFSDCPTPPRKLVSDRELRNKRSDFVAWEGRRSSKIRERFPVPSDHQPMPTLNLIAPIQPSLTLSPFEKPL